MEPPKVPPTTASAPLAPEPLCKVLQPQFDRLTAEFNLGGKLRCEEVPGVVTLGQFGAKESLDRNLLACVDDSSYLAKAVQQEPAAVAGVSYETTATTDESGVLGLGRIAPWLPDIKAEGHAGSRLAMKLTIADATWETIPSISRVFEGQNHAYDCLPALCQNEAKAVYKVLRGRVRVELGTDQSGGFSSGVTLLGGTAGFALEDQSKASSKITLGSSEKLVIGIIAKETMSELTDSSDCDGCGARGQACCGAQSHCDDSLSCLDGTCRPRGYPGAPCDEGRCNNGAACVRGTCRSGCGTTGLPCCEKDACSDGQRCQSGQPARRDVNITDEVIERTGGLFGTDVEVELGSAACGDGHLRSRFATMRVEGDSSHCDSAQWMAPSDANDCRARVHVHVSPFSKIRCRVQIFATEVDPRVPTPQALCK